MQSSNTKNWAKVIGVGAGAAALAYLWHRYKTNNQTAVAASVAAPVKTPTPAASSSTAADVKVVTDSTEMASQEVKTDDKVRSHTCGVLRMSDIGQSVTLAGWVQTVRDNGHVCFIDLRDRYGITQIVVPKEKQDMYELARKFGREYVVRVQGSVVERSKKNKDRATGDIEIDPTAIQVLNSSKDPPFKIQDDTDALEPIRMRYRYLDIRRNCVRERLLLRHKVGMCVRNYLSQRDFVEVETPVLIKSTPEGARDFVVPSRMNPGCFYALPQSPQTFKQLLMVGGMDRYFQIVKCFRDENLRADRQPEFTQIDCEMSFVTREDVLKMFEALIRHVFKEVKGIDLGDFPRMSFDDALKYYGSDKPDTRFEMKFKDITKQAQGKNFKVFDEAEIVLAIVVDGWAAKSNKVIKNLVKLATSKAIGAGGMVWVKHQKDKFQSSVDKFFSNDDLATWAKECESKEGDLILVMSGATNKTRDALGRMRLHMGQELGLMNPSEYKPLWVLDFPLLEWDEEEKRWNAMHHPFTSPYQSELSKLETDPGGVKAEAYDMVINGTEVGGGSIRIHNRKLQELMLKHLGFTDDEAKKQFGFLMDAFEFGAPPHGGIAFGFDRLVSLLGEFSSIRECIAFPKNQQGRDAMIEAPSTISDVQLKELNLKLTVVPKSAADMAAENADTGDAPQKGKKKDKKKQKKQKKQQKPAGAGTEEKKSQGKKKDSSRPRVKVAKSDVTILCAPDSTAGREWKDVEADIRNIKLNGLMWAKDFALQDWIFGQQRLAVVCQIVDAAVPSTQVILDQMNKIAGIDSTEMSSIETAAVDWDKDNKNLQHVPQQSKKSKKKKKKKGGSAPVKVTPEMLQKAADKTIVACRESPYFVSGVPDADGSGVRDLTQEELKTVLTHVRAKVPDVALMLLTAGSTKVTCLVSVPEAQTAQLQADKWMDATLCTGSGSATEAYGEYKVDTAQNEFTIKVKDQCNAMAFTYLRSTVAVDEDSDDEDPITLDDLDD